MFELHNAKKGLFGFWAGAPTTDTTVPHRLAKSFLSSSNDGGPTAQCQTILFGFWGGAPITHTTVPHRLAKVFLDT